MIQAAAHGAAAARARSVRSISFAADWPFESSSRQPVACAAFATNFVQRGRPLSSAASDFVPEEQRKIFVGNIAWKVSSEDLHSHFQQFGEVQDARVIMDRENPFRSRGFGFVTYARPEDAQSAIDMNNEKEWQGRDITVNMANKPREMKKRF